MRIEGIQTQPLQQNIFHDNNGPISIYGPGISESAPKSDIKATTAIPEQLDEWARNTAEAVSVATGNAKYGRGSVIREALIFYKRFYSKSRKMFNNAEKISTFVDML